MYFVSDMDYVDENVFLLKPCLWSKNTPDQISPEDITSLLYNYFSSEFFPQMEFICC